jgi:hypothetical protein
MAEIWENQVEWRGEGVLNNLYQKTAECRAFCKSDETFTEDSGRSRQKKMKKILYDWLVLRKIQIYLIK